MPTLQELQAAEREQGKARLKTLLIEFNDTLKRLPTLHREAKGWLDTDGVDWEGLAVRLEPQLVAAAQWFLRYDRLSRVVQQQPRLFAYQQHLVERATARTLAELLHLSMQEEKTAIDAVEAERTKKEQEQAEARRKAEAKAEIERRKKEQEQAEVQLKAEAKAEIECRKKEQEKAEEARQRAANETRCRLLESFKCVDNGNGTITDKNNNLMWKKSLEAGGARSWEETMKHFSGLNQYAGYGDWRIPTIDELKTLLRMRELFNANGSNVDTWSSTKRSFTSIVIYFLIVLGCLVFVYAGIIMPWLNRLHEVFVILGNLGFLLGVISFLIWVFGLFVDKCFANPWYIDFTNNGVANCEIKYPLHVRLVCTCK